MSRIPLKRWILVLVCLVLAMILGWRGARLSLRDVDASAPRTSAPVVEVRERTASDEGDGQPAQDDEPNVSTADDNDPQLAEVDEVISEPVDDGDVSGAFVLPDEVEYEPDVVLVSLAEGVTAAELEALLAETDEISTSAVSPDEVAEGLVTLEVAQGYSVEDAVNALLGNELIDIVQPNYVYHAMLGDQQDLLNLLAASNEPQVEPLESESGDELVEASVAEEPAEPSAVPEEEPQGAEEGTGKDPDATAEEQPTEDSASEDEAQEEAEPTEGEAEPVQEEALPTDDEGDEPIQDEPEDQPASESAEEEEEAPTLQAQLDVNDPYGSQASSQWSLASIKAYGAWSVARSEGSVTVAVLDQFPYAEHEDLAANVVGTLDAHDAASVPTVTTPQDHGTHVAGIVSAVANNGKGAAGVSYNAGLLLVNVFGVKNGRLYSYTKDLITAYNWVMERAAQHNVRVINLSLGGAVSDTYSFTDDLFLKSVEKARNEYGIVTVAAAANSDSNSGVVPFRVYPGDADDVVCVINLQQDGTGVKRSSTSNYNLPGQTSKNISAPGTNVMSTLASGGYGKMSGTSMASPQVAGVLALEFAANGGLTADQAVSILYSSAEDLNEPGFDEGTGYGEVDALAAVTAAGHKIDGATVILSADTFTYTGAAFEPTVTLTVDDQTLTEGVDYAVAYANNVNAGTATVTISGKGEYVGYASTTFAINPALITDSDVSTPPASAVHTGKAIKPRVNVTVEGEKLVIGTDYTISYKDNVAVGTAQITVKGKGNYQGEVTRSFEIVLPDLSGASVTLTAQEFYTGFALTPSPEVVLGKTTLVEGRDYTVTYRNNVKAGKALVTITGTGGYRGTVSANFSIVKTTGSWQKSGQRWRYRWSDGSYPISQFVKIDRATYWFDDEGWMGTGWHQIDGSWYWFASSGAMATGWIKSGGLWYWMDSTGKMTTGWQKVDGKSYWMDASGAMVTGWKKISGSWYCFANSGEMLTGWYEYEGAWYWLSKSSGKMATGWVKVGSAKYWMKPSGAMATGWQQIDGKWYWFASSGALKVNGWVGNYYVGPDGAMLTSTVTPDGYRVGADGKWDGGKKVA